MTLREPSTIEESTPPPASGNGSPGRVHRIVGRHKTLARVALCAVLGALIVVVLFRVSEVVTLPDEALGIGPGDGGLAAASHELLGRPDPTDFLVDYASAHALTHGLDAYAVARTLIKKVAPDWPVNDANSHPPTLLPLILPFTLVTYHRALEFWSTAMIIAIGITLLLIGVRWPIAAAGGIALGLTMPGAYAIGNPVPLIGLGVAMAYRFRDRPWLAGLGIALATAPKLSGVILLIPFVLSQRFRAVAWAVGFLAILATIPVILQPTIWARYLKAGLQAIAMNEARYDNASLLKSLAHLGVPTLMGLTILGAGAVLAVLISRDVFWPAAWLMVASLPLAWLYSLITLVPVGASILIRRRSPLSASLLILAAGLTLASSPSGEWPVVVFPAVTVIVYLALIVAPPDPEPEFPLQLLPAQWLARLRLLDASATVIEMSEDRRGDQPARDARPPSLIRRPAAQSRASSASGRTHSPPTRRTTR